MWYHQESNQGHKDFQSFALPTELWYRKNVFKYITLFRINNIVCFHKFIENIVSR